MVKVDSNSSIVGQIAGNMESAANVEGIGTAEYARKTTVAGNRLSEETMKAHSDVFNELLAAFRKDASRLRKVSLEFDQTDQHIANMLVCE